MPVGIGMNKEYILYFYMGKIAVRLQHGLQVRAHTAVKIWFNNASLLPALL